ASAENLFDRRAALACSGDHVKERRFLALGIDGRRLPAYAGELRGGADGVVETAEGVDQLEGERLLPCEDAAVGDVRDVRFGHLSLAARGEARRRTREAGDH